MLNLLSLVLGQILELSHPPNALNSKKSVNTSSIVLEDGLVRIESGPHSFDNPRDILFSSRTHIIQHPNVVYVRPSDSGDYIKIFGFENEFLRETLARVYFADYSFESICLSDYSRLRYDVFRGVSVPESVAVFFSNFVLSKNTVVYNSRGYKSCLNVFKPFYELSGDFITPKLYFKIESYQSNKKKAYQSGKNEESPKNGDKSDTKSTKDDALVVGEAGNQDGADVDLNAQENSKKSDVDFNKSELDHIDAEKNSNDTNNTPENDTQTQNKVSDDVMDSLEQMLEFDKNFFAPTNDPNFDSLFIKHKDASLKNAKFILETIEVIEFGHFSDHLMECFVNCWIRSSILRNLKEAADCEHIKLRFIDNLYFPNKFLVKELVRDLRRIRYKDHVSDIDSEDGIVFFEPDSTTKNGNEKSLNNKSKEIETSKKISGSSDDLNLQESLKKISDGIDVKDLPLLQRFILAFRNILQTSRNAKGLLSVIKKLLKCEKGDRKIVSTSIAGDEKDICSDKMDQKCEDADSRYESNVNEPRDDAASKNIRSTKSEFSYDTKTEVQTAHRLILDDLNYDRINYGPIYFDSRNFEKKDMNTYTCDIKKPANQQMNALVTGKLNPGVILDCPIINHLNQKLMLLFIDLDGDYLRMCFKELLKIGSSEIGAILLRKEAILSFEQILEYSDIQFSIKKEVSDILQKLFKSTTTLENWNDELIKIHSLLKSDENASEDLLDYTLTIKDAFDIPNGNINFDIQDIARKLDTSTKDEILADYERYRVQKLIRQFLVVINNRARFEKSYPQMQKYDLYSKSVLGSTESNLCSHENPRDVDLSELAKANSAFISQVTKIHEKNLANKSHENFSKNNSDTSLENNRFNKNDSLVTKTSQFENNQNALSYIYDSLNDGILNEPLDFHSFELDYQNYLKTLIKIVEQKNTTFNKLEDLELKLTQKPPSILKNSIYNTLPSTLLFGNVARSLEKSNRMCKQPSMLIHWLDKLHKKQNREIKDFRVSQNYEKSDAFEKNYTDVIDEISINHFYQQTTNILTNSLAQASKIFDLKQFEFALTKDVVYLLFMHFKCEIKSIQKLIKKEDLEKILKSADSELTNIQRMFSNTSEINQKQKNLFKNKYQEIIKTNDRNKALIQKYLRYKRILETALQKENQTEKRIPDLFKHAKNYLSTHEIDVDRVFDVFDQIENDCLLSGNKQQMLRVDKINEFVEFALCFDSKVTTFLNKISAEKTQKMIEEQRKKDEKIAKSKEQDQKDPFDNKVDIEKTLKDDDTGVLKTDTTRDDYKLDLEETLKSVGEDINITDTTKADAPLIDESSEMIDQRVDL